MDPMRRLPRLVAVLSVLAAPLLVTGTAAADEPFAVTGQVSDPADVLSSTEESQVQSALDDLQSEDGIQLYVVYVDSYDGAQPATWANQAFQQSTLGNGDVLFAVAAEDHRDGYHVGPNTDVTQTGLADLVSGDVESQLGSGDWSAAAVTLA